MINYAHKFLTFNLIKIKCNFTKSQTLMSEKLTKPRKKKKNQNITQKKNKDLRNSLWISPSSLKGIDQFVISLMK